MYSHVTLGIADFDRARAFFDAILPMLGLTRIFDDPEHGWIGYATAPDATPQFYIGRPIDGESATVGNGVTVAFAAPDRETVRRLHAKALELGMVDEGAPGLRPHYHADYFGAYFRDPDGHKICVVCHRPE